MKTSYFEIDAITARTFFQDLDPIRVVAQVLNLGHFWVIPFPAVGLVILWFRRVQVGLPVQLLCVWH